MSNYTNKLSFVHRARRNAEEEPDLMLKWKLIKVLRTKFNIVSRTGPKIAIHRRYGYIKTALKRNEVKDFYLHDPDCTSLNHNLPLIFEIDGDIHTLKAKGIKQTNARNLHYEQAIILGKHPKLIWLTDKECELTDEQLSLILRQKFFDQGIKVNVSD